MSSWPRPPTGSRERTAETGASRRGDQSSADEPPIAFVSHASEDKLDFVVPLATELRRLGVDAWLDAWEIKPGDSLVNKIFDEGLARADAFVVVVSNASAAKPWVRDELDAATVQRINRGARLITVILDNADAPAPVKHLLWISAERTSAGSLDVAQQIADVLHGHDRKPPLGPTPAYTTSPAFPGLTAQDSIVLVEITRQALETGHLIALPWQPILERVTALDVTSDAALEALEALELQYLIEFQAYGTDVSWTSLTTHGYATAIGSLVEDVEDIQQKVIGSLVNGLPTSPRVVKDLAAELNAPELVVGEALQALDDRGLITFRRYMGDGSRVHSISGTLRRLLD